MDILNKVWNYLTNCFKVLMEIKVSGESHRYVISFDEWQLIKQWYYDEANNENYTLTLDDSVDSFAIVRLNKLTTEIRVWELSRTSVFLKNLYSVLAAPVPGIIRFFTSFFITVLAWPIIAAVSFIQKTDLTDNALSLGTNITSLIFVTFLLFNLLHMVFRIFDSIINRYRAFIRKEEGFITDTVAFNVAMLILFVNLGGDKLVQLAEELWNYVSAQM